MKKTKSAIHSNKTLATLHYIFLAVSLVILMIYTKIDIKPDWLKYSVLTLLILIYVTSLVLGLISWRKYKLLNADNSVEETKFSYEHYDKMGYGLFTGGIVAYATTDRTLMSLGIIGIGFTCIFIYIIRKKKYDRFQELVKDKK
jgi:hypothetical protein